MSKTINDRIYAVVKYLYEDEKKHYDESDRPDDHIFLDVIALKNYLESQNILEVLR